MLNLFSAEPALENIFSDEQIRPLIHILRREGKAEEVIYHTENKESFRYVITTKIHNNTDEKLILTTTSVEKFKLQEDEFLEFVQASLDSGLVREKQYTFPLQQDYNDHACFECLRPIAIKHLRCINKVEKILSAPSPQVVVQDKSSHTTLLLFVLLITLIGGSFFLLRPLLNNQQSADLTLLFNTEDVQVQLGAKTYSSTEKQLNLTLPLGRYRLLAKKPGYKPVRQDIFLAADEEKDIQLEKLHTLTVYADMEDSRVLLNGNIMGTAGNATPLKLTLTEGLYELSLTHPAISTSFQKKFQLNNDQIIKANLPHPSLTIHLNVDDARITVAGKEYQVKGNELVLKPPFGSHQLIAHKDGYTSVEKEVRIKQQDQTLPITLEQILYRLSVTPNVANSSITVSCQNGEKYFGIASPDTPFQVETATELCTVPTP
ncbi:MAG: PEGA domain-containing protein, partial [Candidatus Electrothrix sp. ATG1]|nr:PEGA domain-containing protein [Candidatus Electrothrix sp. ATG1]